MGLTADPSHRRATPAGGNAISSARVFPARLSALPEVAAFIAETGVRAGVPPGACQKLALLVEELFTNTVEHGHAGDSDEPVRVELEVEPGRFTMTYEDTAPPYDPFSGVQPPDETADVDERPVGGLGVLLVATLARDVEYRRVENRNRIRLVMAVPA
jgi:anti-sigma regulatory factor (Ser/Thr protein kinase)